MVDSRSETLSELKLTFRLKKVALACGNTISIQSLSLIRKQYLLLFEVLTIIFSISRSNADRFYRYVILHSFCDVILRTHNRKQYCVVSVLVIDKGTSIVKFHRTV